MDDTGAALAGVAADMGARQVQMIAQEIDKEGPVLDLSRDRLAVHRQFDCRHVETSPCFLIAPIRSTGPGLCNNDFCRGNHCDAICASRRMPPAIPSWRGFAALTFRRPTIGMPAKPRRRRGPAIPT